MYDMKIKDDFGMLFRIFESQEINVEFTITDETYNRLKPYLFQMKILSN